MTSNSNTMTEDYLKTLYSAEERFEDGVGVTELARRMGVVASTASENVRKLHRSGLVNHAPYQKVHLTDRGREEAVAIVRRHRILEAYLYERLDFDWDEVHREAEILEHAVSDALLNRMNEVLGYPVRDPHGDPIPQNGRITQPEHLVTLGQLAVGQRAVVTRISDEEPALLRHLESIGIVLDSSIILSEHLGFVGVVKGQATPPQSWKPRNPELLAEGIAPGRPCSFDLGDIAADSIWVSLGE